MVLGIIGAVAGVVAIPMSAVAVPNAASAIAISTVGVSQGSMRGEQQQGRSGGEGAGPDPNDPRLEKFTLKTHCEEGSSSKNKLDRRQVVLRKGQLYLDSTTKPRYKDGHPFSGFYLDYPINGQPRGLVSTISKDPPELNWIYVDKDTLELKYGNKTASKEHVVGSWDWTEDQNGLTLEGWEGFVAMQVGDGGWILCYDREDDQLKRVRGNRRVVEVQLDRKLLPKSPSAN